MKKLSIIWLLPVLAVVLSAWLAIESHLEKGPEISIRFASAEGIEKNRTKLKFKDVDIGTVADVTIDADGKFVLVKVSTSRQARKFLVSDSKLWVVRPQVAVRGVSGLGTLLSGAYIAIDPGKSAETKDDFIGLELPPLVTSDTAGQSYTLMADDLGSLDTGAPVYFRKVQVGQVIGHKMREDGKGLEIEVFVNHPFHKFIRSNTKFWHASGIDLKLDSSGVSLDVQSLLSLAIGGIAFATPDSESSDEDEPNASKRSYHLHSGMDAALKAPDSNPRKYSLIFDESIKGLNVGSPVDFNGIKAGEVSRIELGFKRQTARFQMLVEINLYPERFYRIARKNRSATPGRESEAATRVTLDKMVSQGLRAQLQTGNIITGQKFVSLDFFEQVKPAKMDWSAAIPVIPTQPGTLDSLQDQLADIVTQLRKSLQSVDSLVNTVNGELAPEISKTLAEARVTLKSANLMIGSAEKGLAADAPIQLELRKTLNEVSMAARSVKDLADLLERNPQALILGNRESTP